MTRNKSKIFSDTLDLSPQHFDMTKTSSADSASIAAEKLIHELEKSTLESTFKVKEPALSVIKKLPETFQMCSTTTRDPMAKSR